MNIKPNTLKETSEATPEQMSLLSNVELRRMTYCLNVTKLTRSTTPEVKLALLKTEVALREEFLARGLSYE